MPRRSDARPKAIETTAQLLQRQGFAATGLEEILATSGAPKGSFYFHFPGGKEELAAEAVAWSGEAVLAALEHAIARSDSPGDAIRRFATMQAAQLTSSDFALGCPVATVALEMSSRSEPIRKASEAAMRSWIDRLGAVLIESGVAPGEAEELAEWTIASLEGALLLARARRDEGVVTRVAARLADVVEAATRG
ncbi:MAG TPA: TetR/AcrR family transcriptional regulator [Acidimicrobiia bacterium]|nr:TetR/AcrR family transcriptional regulator [Acidimicrobiia bacterium]